MTDQSDTPPLIAVEVSEALAGLLKDHPLPAGVLDADLNQEDMAAALNTSVNTLSKWIRTEGFPVASGGGMGKPYILRLSHGYAWNQARAKGEQALRDHNSAQVSMLQAKFLNMSVDDPNAGLTPKQRTELATADIQHSRAMQLRRQLVPLADVVDLIESLMRMTRDKVEALPDLLERELNLKPAEVLAVQRHGSDLLTDLASTIEEAELKERDVAEVDLQPTWVNN